MRARLFKSQFAPLVKSGAKRQTLRPTPKRMPKIGEKESWREWTGKPYRSRQNELARVELTKVERIAVNTFPTEDLIILGGMKRRLATLEEQEQIAVADGFKSFKEMGRWFHSQYGECFDGILIQAKDIAVLDKII